MDLRKKWGITYQSICSIKHYDVAGQLISSGTGFKITNNKILTNNHVFVCPSAKETKVTFFSSDGFSVSQESVFKYLDFSKLLIAGDPIDGWDFAIFDGAEFNTVPGLYLSKGESEYSIGSEIYFLGFPLKSDSLTIHGGNISAKYKHTSGIKYIQLDSSINSGNSGGPLIDFETDYVIGLITRKNRGLTEKFDQLKESFRTNIKKLESQDALMDIGGIDPIQALRITQAQLDILSDEISRSSNVGIGYAFELDIIRQYL